MFVPRNKFMKKCDQLYRWQYCHHGDGGIHSDIIFLGRIYGKLCDQWGILFWCHHGARVALFLLPSGSEIYSGKRKTYYPSSQQSQWSCPRSSRDFRVETAFCTISFYIATGCVRNGRCSSVAKGNASHYTYPLIYP